MKKTSIVLSSLIMLSFVVLSTTPIAYGNEIKTPNVVNEVVMIQGMKIDMTYSFMQVLDQGTIRLRNILLTGEGINAFYKADFIIGLGIIPGSVGLEGTNQRPYVLETRTITIDGDKSNWNGILPAFEDPKGDSVGPPGTDMKGIYLAKDSDYLYVLMTLYDPPITDGSTIYIFSSHTVPELAISDIYCWARPSISGLDQVSIYMNRLLKLTNPDSPHFPTDGLVNTYPGMGFVAYGSDFVEWKVPLSDFPLEVLSGKYVHGGIELGEPGQEDTTATEEGVYIVIK